MASFNHFLDVSSAQDERINFSSFACCQASWDTSLEYPQRVLSRKKYFRFINFLGPNRKPKWPKNIFLAPESYYLHINTWNFTWSRIQKQILGISLRLTGQAGPCTYILAEQFKLNSSHKSVSSYPSIHSNYFPAVGVFSKSPLVLSSCLLGLSSFLTAPKDNLVCLKTFPLGPTSQE